MHVPSTLESPLPSVWAFVVLSWDGPGDLCCADCHTTEPLRDCSVHGGFSLLRRHWRLVGRVVNCAGGRRLLFGIQWNMHSLFRSSVATPHWWWAFGRLLHLCDTLLAHPHHHGRRLQERSTKDLLANSRTASQACHAWIKRNLVCLDQKTCPEPVLVFPETWPKKTCSSWCSLRSCGRKDFQQIHC